MTSGYKQAVSADEKLLSQLPRQSGGISEGLAVDDTLSGLMPTFAATPSHKAVSELSPILSDLLRQIVVEFGPLGYGVTSAALVRQIHGEPDPRWISRLDQARHAATSDAIRRSIGDLVDAIIDEIAPSATRYRMSDADEWTRARRNVARTTFTRMSGGLQHG